MSSTKRLLSRRNILQSAALAALLAPVMRWQDARADLPAAPRRVILIYSACGPMVVSGPASGSETNFTFKDWWKPLEPYKADGIFFSNLSSAGSKIAPGPYNGVSGGHGLGGQCFAGYGTLSDGYASAGETIDQLIGRRLEAENRAGVVRSVVWGLSSNPFGGNVWTSNQGGRPIAITPEPDPSKAWAALFGNFVGNGASDEEKARAAAALAKQKSVLDFVNADCASLKTALGAEGARLLDEHCTTLRSMEQNLSSTLTAGGSCAKPPQPVEQNWENPEVIDAQMDAYIDLMAMSLACELTNVIAFEFASGAIRLASSYGVPSSPLADSGDSGPAHHPWTHQNLTIQPTHDAMRIFMTFYSTQVAKLVGKLKSTLDASGKPLLDSTMVLWLTELGGQDNNTYEGHICTGQPAILFGGGQGTFRTGRFLQGPSQGIDIAGEVEGGRMSAQLLVSLIQYMGFKDVNTVGATGVSGPLTSLYV
jgi:hypothetical protein